MKRHSPKTIQPFGFIEVHPTHIRFTLATPCSGTVTGTDFIENLTKRLEDWRTYYNIQDYQLRIGDPS